MKPPFIVCLALAFSLLGSGCVLGRRTVDLSIPTAASLPAAKGTVAINSITDVRHFENKPSEPSTPSIDGDVNSLSAAQLAIVIGRQRNGYGHAMGDVALPPDKTVQRMVMNLVEQEFARRGYRVTTDASADNTVDVKIDKFWAWMPYSSIAAQIECSFTVKRDGHATTFTAEGSGVAVCAISYSNDDWQLAYTRAFDDFLGKFDQELAKAGF